MFLEPLPMFLVLLGAQYIRCQGEMLAVKENTVIDFVFSVPSSYWLMSSKSGFVNGTADTPCNPTKKCVEFYPSRRSFLIESGYLKNFSRVILRPTKPDLAEIAFVVVREDQFFPAIHDVGFVKPFSHGSWSPQVAVVMNEEIKMVRVLDETAGLKIVIPSDENGPLARKLMRVTGLMETSTLSFTLMDARSQKITFTFLSNKNGPRLMRPTHFLQWPRRGRPSGAQHQFKASIFLISLVILNMLINSNMRLGLLRA